VKHLQFLLLILGFGAAGLTGNDALQGEPPQYRAGYFSCAAFLEEVRTAVTARRGMESWQEQGRREGRMLVNASQADDRLSFEAWYDSLSVLHDGRHGRLRPDTDGLVGGRWRGFMAPHGAVELTERPFIPPELISVSDLSDQLLDFFPPLPTQALAIRDRWTDSLGLEIERLPDSSAADRTLERYRWIIRSEGGSMPFGGDTLVRLRQNIRDEGVVAWSRSSGPLTWHREIVVDAAVASTRSQQSPVQSRVSQSITVRRATVAPACS
jgi:hypothetical protein